MLSAKSYIEAVMDEPTEGIGNQHDERLIKVALAGYIIKDDDFRRKVINWNIAKEAVGRGKTFSHEAGRAVAALSGKRSTACVLPCISLEIEASSNEPSEPLGRRGAAVGQGLGIVTATAILDLERAGFTREQVEALARLLETQTVTKADLAEAKAELKADIAQPAQAS